MKRVISFILLILTLSLSLTSCDMLKSFLPVPDEKKIENRIEAFVPDYNGGDVKAAMNSLAKKPRNALNAVLGILEMISGYDASAIFSYAFTLGIAVDEGDFMEVEILETKVDGEKAVVKSNISFNTNMGEESEISYFIMTKEDDDWYIYDITSKSPQ